jgi:hypothetical protein
LASTNDGLAEVEEASMRFPLAILCVAIGATSAWAANDRWTTGFGQGTFEAIIRNSNRSSVNLYCPEGQEDTTPGMFIEVKRVQPAAKEKVTVQIIVDGVIHEFLMDEIQFRPDTKTDWSNYYALAGALTASGQKSFVVKFPKYNVEETFSLNGARKALGLGKNSILEDCRQPN